MSSADESFQAAPKNKLPAGKGEPFAKSQLDFDIAFFDRILQRRPDYVDVLRCQGELLSRKGLHQLALAVDRRLAELLPEDYVVRYNLACSLAVGGYRREAIATLRTASSRVTTTSITWKATATWTRCAKIQPFAPCCASLAS